MLEDGERTFYIVGTAHVSEASANEVREVIEAVQPDTVCLELCQTRYDALTDEDRWKKLDVFRVIRDGKTLMLLANLADCAVLRAFYGQLGINCTINSNNTSNIEKENPAQIRRRKLKSENYSRYVHPPNLLGDLRRHTAAAPCQVPARPLAHATHIASRRAAHQTWAA